MNRYSASLNSFFIFLLTLFFIVPVTAQTFSKATKTKNTSCPNGSFFDPIDNGTCWSCPSGYKRTVFSVKSNKACERAAKTAYAKAIDKGKGRGILGTDCPRGAFYDPNGRCYTCPSGYNRTTASVTSNKACSRRVSASFKSANKVATLSCGKGTFFDPVDGGSCWSCPKGSKRTVFSVKSAKACEIPAKYKKKGLSASEKQKLKRTTQQFVNQNKALIKTVEGIHGFLNSKDKAYFTKGSFISDIENGRYNKVWSRLEPQLRPFIKSLRALNKKQSGELKKFRALTLSASGGGGFAVGASTTTGFIIILNPDNTVTLQGFTEFGGTVGTSIGIYSAVAVGLYKAKPTARNSSKFTLDCGSGFSVGMGFSVGPVGVGGGIAIDPYLVCNNNWAGLVNLSAIEGIYIEGSISVSPKWAIPVDVNAAFSSSLVWETSQQRGLRSKCSDCGGPGQRPCAITERFPSCDPGLRERCETCN